MYNFSSFIEQLSSKLAQPLPGEDAHFRMAPMNRKVRLEALMANASPKLSAVMVLCYPVNNQPYSVLTLRHQYEGVHSGQVSFPGGKKEDYDSTLQETALRETREEIGVAEKTVKIIGPLSELYIPPSGFLVQPFVGVLPQRPSFIPDPTEVNRIIEFPLARLQQKDTIKHTEIPIGKQQTLMHTPYFDIDNQIVWGATAMMLSEVKALLEP